MSEDEKQIPIQLTAATIIKVEAYDLDRNSKAIILLDGDVRNLVGHIDSLIVDALKGLADET